MIASASVASLRFIHIASERAIHIAGIRIQPGSCERSATLVTGNLPFNEWTEDHPVALS
jgi:hypothetical protein